MAGTGHVSNLKAAMQVNPDGTRRQIKSAIRENIGAEGDGGMLGKAAEALGVSYQTLWRIIVSDEELKAFTNEAKEKDFKRKGWKHGKRRMS